MSSHKWAYSPYTPVSRMRPASLRVLVAGIHVLVSGSSLKRNRTPISRLMTARRKARSKCL